ncbi:hypothetical protein CDAR_212721 [Caerostris darwini]|uniref:Uncharacterized protein n=1 Tax=Caerostris darwini TaxID=1538125 RepID=A0AAV4PY90_9ARAC|nr:hypothetical protein CDAR_212721 [Caerostris darwini]
MAEERRVSVTSASQQAVGVRNADYSAISFCSRCINMDETLGWRVRQASLQKKNRAKRKLLEGEEKDKTRQRVEEYKSLPETLILEEHASLWRKKEECLSPQHPNRQLALEMLIIRRFRFAPEKEKISQSVEEYKSLPETLILESTLHYGGRKKCVCHLSIKQAVGFRNADYSAISFCFRFINMDETVEKDKTRQRAEEHKSLPETLILEEHASLWRKKEVCLSSQPPSRQLSLEMLIIQRFRFASERDKTRQNFEEYKSLPETLILEEHASLWQRKKSVRHLSISAGSWRWKC